MKIENNVSLKSFNTFGVEAMAKQFVKVNNESELKEVLSENPSVPILILGGGSNMLLTRDLDELVIFNNMKGIAVVAESDDYVQVQASAGENWHQLVLWCLDHNYGGIENLALIPGSVGAAPIQNIGAYGVELKEVFTACHAIHVKTGESQRFDRNTCDFGYRHSIFKTTEKGNWIITSVILELSKNHHHLKTDYGAIQEQLDELGIKEPTIRDVAQAVISIRSSKLPDPKKLGNSGSFFKNPVVSKSKVENLLQSNTDMPYFELSEGDCKIPAAWLIEQSGFKGKRVGNCGAHEKQALVLVNFGDASGSDILSLATDIQNEVNRKFGILLEMEVNIL